VTALDLKMPAFNYPRVISIAGNAPRLQFADSSFYYVFHAEVSEHISALEDAYREMARVARHEVVIGAPYKQDTRAGRTTCQQCRKPNPPWGHSNRFDERRPDLTAVFTL
jgi:ubiquinone/menaquinone biosynthesis C-methylase UbiE